MYGQGSSESGFSLVEIIVALVIVAILMAAAIGSFGSSKDSANRAKVVAAAQSYDQAIASFAADHLGAIPVPPAPGVTSDPKKWQSLSRGPLEPSVSASGVQQPYLRSMPESVADKSVAVAAVRPTPGSAVVVGSVGSIVVLVDRAGTSATRPPTRYRVEVWAGKRGKFDTRPTCVMGTWPAESGVPTC